ncbi:hypothetical protein NDU88_007123 [Pleurodeles waltl]|uniref:Uncharacterized protein n=1 Tax=Pleurodeles waltl TaxID=8319 RepID=A0AAV7NSS2_PLEWA|nr:hypothetical protein NDU88_007123 [Pleurodeles waltl]
MTNDKPPSLTAKQSTIDKFTSTWSAAMDPGAATRPGLDNVALLAAIMQSCDMLDVKIGAVDSEVTLLYQALQSEVDGITEAEIRVSGIVDSVTALQQKVHKLTAVTKELATHVEDAEAWACCKNLCLALPLQALSDTAHIELDEKTIDGELDMVLANQESPKAY